MLLHGFFDSSFELIELLLLLAAQSRTFWSLRRKFYTGSEDLDSLSEAQILFHLFEVQVRGLDEDGVLCKALRAIPPAADEPGHKNAKKQTVDAKHIAVVLAFNDPFWQSDTHAELLLAIWMTVLFEVLADGLICQAGTQL